MARERTTAEAFTVYGAHAVASLLESDAAVRRVVVLAGRGATDAATRARARGVDVVEVDRPALDRLAGTPHHQGVAAIAEPYRYVTLETAIEAGGRGVLVLDSIQDPRNLGAILRTARAAGAGGVILPQDRSVGITGVVAGASAGALFGLRVARVPNLSRALEALKNAGFWSVGLVPGVARSLYQLPDLPRVALVLGGEGEGLRPLIRRGCDFEVAVPMASGVESLNVSVAAAVALYELFVRPRPAPGAAS